VDKLVVRFDGEVPAAFVAEARTLDALDAVLNHKLNVTLAKRGRRRRATPGRRLFGPSPSPVPPAPGQKCLALMAGVSPNCLRSAYGLPNATAPAGGDASVHQAFIVNQGFLPSDLAHFQREYHLATNPVQTVVGKNTGGAGDEASLDSQYITTTGAGAPTTYVSLGNQANPFSNWLVWAANASDAELPAVHSLSLGAPEDAVGDALIGRMNTEMAALGARGVTVVFASGDNGYQSEMNFGAASPYVLAVGGVFNGDLRMSSLEADYITCGGFAASKLNKAQPWQAAAIASYAKHKDGGSARVVKGQRAVPDVSAYDDSIEYVQGGSDGQISGTSAAAPIVAGIVQSLNAALARAGHKTTMGFINPFIYAHESAFLDITQGSNNGIDACKGYDPVSGVGTFGQGTYAALEAAALKAAAKL
jgi:tripeptidyl-peptidase-1